MRKGFVWTLLGSVVLLAACSGTPEVQIPADEPTDGPVTLRVLGSGMNLDDVIQAFDAQHPNVRVERLGSEDDPATADVRWVNAELIRTGKVLPLDALVQKSGLDLKPYGELVQHWEGKLYDLPVSHTPYALVYNQDLFTKAGIKPPGDVVTWDQVRELARAVSRDDDPGLYTDYPEFLVSMYLGQTTFSPVPAKDLTEALQFFQTMIVTDKTMPATMKRDWTATNVPASNRDLFGKGWAGMTQGHISFTYGPSPWHFNTGYLLVKNAKGVPTSVQSLGISATTHHPTAAWEFLSFVAGSQGQAVVAQRELPAYRTPETEAAWFAQEPAPPPATRALFQIRWYVVSSTKNDSRTNSDAFMNAANQVLSGQSSVAEAVKAYQQTSK